MEFERLHSTWIWWQCFTILQISFRWRLHERCLRDTHRSTPLRMLS